MRQDVIDLNNRMKKAMTLDEIDQAVPFNIPITPDHPFFINFAGLRGDFEDRIVYRILNVKQKKEKFTFDYKVNSFSKTLLFLGGMRGSGKTSELAKYTKNLDNKNCFFVVTCNLDDELTMDNLEYMDILIFQLEKLTKKLDENNISINNNALERLQSWFSDRVKEVNSSIKGEVKLEVGADVGESFLGKLLGLVSSLKVGVTGSKKRALIIRTTLKDRFNEFALKFNEYVEEANIALRKKNKGQEVLFIIDGIEKALSTEIAKKLIIEEQGYIQQIKAYTVFTLPIFLMRERRKLEQFAKVESFPFVRIQERNGDLVQDSINKFNDFILKRIDKSLFESDDIIQQSILLSGGSPRELLRILETTAFYADTEKGLLDQESLDKATKRLASQASNHLTKEQLAKLKELKELNEKGEEIPFDDVLQELLEKIIVMEYNDGNYKRVNPLVEMSRIYKQHVSE